MQIVNLKKKKKSNEFTLDNAPYPTRISKLMLKIWELYWW